MHNSAFSQRLGARTRRYLTVWLALALIVSMVVGCRRAQDSGPARATSTITPTPFSTALPALATNIPTGIESNPLQMYLQTDATPAERAEAIRVFQEAMLAQANPLYVQVIVVDTPSEALAALCRQEGQTVAIAWLNGIGYMAAKAENCGAPILLIERGGEPARAVAQATAEATAEGTAEPTIAPTRTPRGGPTATPNPNAPSIGLAAQIITARGGNISGLGGLSGSNFCRLSNTDFYSWLAPSLMLKADDIDPLTTFATVTDYPDTTALITAVAERECAAAAIPANTFAAAALATDANLAELQGRVRVIETSQPFLYGVLMYPVELPLGVRIPLTQGLKDLALDPTSGAALRVLLGQSNFVDATSERLTAFERFMESTDLDFALMGS
jgi:ABC-type phosphate/phosphonate transport system substrate-binding protein